MSATEFEDDLSALNKWSLKKEASLWYPANWAEGLK
jgi:hypothetical protein